MKKNYRARGLAAIGFMTVACAAIDDLVNGPSKLAIQSFWVSPKEVPQGMSATLFWEVSGADDVQIDNGVGSVPVKGNLTVRPDLSRTYTLSARSGTSNATSSVVVVVTGTSAGASPSPSPSISPTPRPSVTPTPSPTSSPSPSPTPSATPTPAPTPSPSSNACRLPAMPECGADEGPSGVFGCCRAEKTWAFGDAVEAALDTIQHERPELFDGDRPKDQVAYIQGVAAILQRNGYCATPGGPEDEVAVKNSNSFSEQYDILLANGRIRHGGYTVTCRPARF